MDATTMEPAAIEPQPQDKPTHIAEYDVVYGYQDEETMPEFITRVNARLAEGWVPFGGVSHARIPVKGSVVAQAMVRMEDGHL